MTLIEGNILNLLTHLRDNEDKVTMAREIALMPVEMIEWMIDEIADGLHDVYLSDEEVSVIQAALEEEWKTRDDQKPDDADRVKALVEKLDEFPDCPYTSIAIVMDWTDDDLEAAQEIADGSSRKMIEKQLAYREKNPVQMGVNREEA